MSKNKPPRMEITADNEFRCPECGHEGSMSRVTVQRVWDKIYYQPAWEGIEASHDDSEDLEEPEYSCRNHECMAPLRLPKVLEEDLG